VNLAHACSKRDWVVLLAPQSLLPHEHHDPVRAHALATEISASGLWWKPLLIEANHLIILDGHHRRAAAIQLGLQAVPAILIPYDDPRLTLTSWRPGEQWSRTEIIARAQRGKLCPIKTTRHRLDREPEAVAVSLAELSRIRTSLPCKAPQSR
jgi:L-serine kinase (ADP)